MTVHNYRSRQRHETLNGINPSTGFRDMRSAKSGPNLWQIWQVFGPWASPYGANGRMSMIVHNYRPRQFQRTSNGENPSCGYRDMGSTSLAAARPTARPPARTVTTIPFQPGGLRGKKWKVCHRLHNGIPEDNVGNKYCNSGRGRSSTHQRKKWNWSQHPVNDYENQWHKETKVHKEMEPGKQGRVEGIQQKSNRKRKRPPYRTRTLRRSRKANKNPPETNNRREANQNRQSKKNQQQRNKETQGRKEKSQKKNFQEACKDQNNPKKVETKINYMESQKKLREAIENEESRKIEARLQELSKKAKINPNIIWETRKRAKGCNGLDHNTVDEYGKRITNPQETKAHIADYFEDLYQAREGTEEYREWTHKIKEAVEQALKPSLKSAENDQEISSKEFNTVIKKTQKEKKPGTRQNPQRNLHRSQPRNERSPKKHDKQCPYKRRNTRGMGGGWNNKAIQRQRC